MIKIKPLPPTSIEELQQRAFTLAGKTLYQLALEQGLCVPTTLHHAKGWIGQLLENALGANANNLDQPDFTSLGIELKTLPINAQGQPIESTYICTAPIPNRDPCFEQSRVWRKMAHMLWVPILSLARQPIKHRQIGTPILWSPDPLIFHDLKQDWEELMELMSLGHFEDLSAHKGKYLQIRPKAANSKTFVRVLNHEGQMISTVPKGFYVRTLLTQRIIQENYIT